MNDAGGNGRGPRVFDLFADSGVYSIGATTIPDDAVPHLMAFRRAIAGADPVAAALARSLLARHLADLGYLDPGRIVEGVCGRPPANAYSPVPTFTRDDVETLSQVAEVPDLIDGVLAAGAFGILFGPPGAGKSFLGLDWGLCVAHGLPWCGHAVTPGRVVYWSGEGSRSRLSARIRAWRAHHRTLDFVPPFDVMTGAFGLLEADHVNAFIAEARQGTAPLAGVVLDTWSRGLAGADENKPDVQGGAVAAADRIRAELGCAVLALHHTPHAQPERERGHSALRGAADVMWGLTDDEGDRVLKGSKVRDGDLGPPRRFRLQPVEDSCVLVPCEDQPHGTLSASERRALEGLVESTPPDEVLSSKAWQETVPIGRGTLYRARTRLIALGYARAAAKSGTVATASGRAFHRENP